MKLLQTPHMPSGLPMLEPELTALLDQQHHILSARIHAESGFIPFDRWMHECLYAPGYGYYTGGSTKFGSTSPQGDFTTAPELTPLFGQTVALQIQQVLQQLGSVNILEFGAGTGAWAKSIIPALADLGIEANYAILELSPDLQQRQQHTLAEFGSQVQWLQQLPENFVGCVIANEVLDAMPVHMVQRADDGSILEVGVTLADPATATGPLVSPFQWAAKPAAPELAAIAEERLPNIPGYRTEINLQAEAWVKGAGQWLQRGAILLFDYGFPRHEYYHGQREEGTLMCHFRHYAHAEALLYPGLQDITAHVDFTAMADAALEGGLDVLGYTAQGRFLLNSGLAQRLGQAPDSQNAEATARWAHTVGAVQKLLSEAEMGELFKVLALGKDVDPPLIGFFNGDRRDRL
ncbi:class I SAM-dependent methyltransferase [Paenalcaligenes sp. Me131]|uniref:class I SAM-dependent methyltransferase n=1 Tax=Paenalcaligenes sp. Me131 TaxID=3392636 RepID=UPI003D28B897